MLVYKECPEIRLVRSSYVYIYIFTFMDKKKLKMEQ